MANSVILGFFMLLYNWLISVYEGSLLKVIVDRICRFFSPIITGSMLYKLMIKDERATGFWQSSLFYRAISGIIWLVNSIAEILYKVLKPAVESSLILSNERGSAILKTRTFIYAIIVFLPLTPSNTYIVALIILTAVVFLIESSVTASRATPPSMKLSIKNIDFALMLFGIFLVLSTITSSVQNESLNTLIFYAAGFALVIIITSFVGSFEDIYNMSWVILLSTVIPCFVALYQRINPIPIDVAYVDVEFNQGMPSRIFSTLDNPNNFAEYLILALLVGIAVVLIEKNIYKKLFAAGIWVLGLACLGLSLSRTGYIAITFGIMLFIVIKNKKLIPVFIAGAVVGFFLLPDYMVNRIITIVQLKDSSFLYRTYIWQGAFKMLKDFWITGIGLGTAPFGYVYKGYMSSLVTTTAHSHNLFLQLWLELGILGFLSFVWFTIRSFKKSITYSARKQRDNMGEPTKTFRDKGLDYINIGALCAVMALLLMGVAEHVWFYQKIMLQFWLTVGVLWSAIKLYSIKV